MKAFKLLRLSETTGATHARNRTAQRPNTPDAESRLPHRPLTLHALRQLARGHYLFVGGQTSFAVRLAGVPDAVHLVDEFIARHLVDRLDLPDCDVACYALSETGRDTLARGEQWWRELTPIQRAVVHITG